MIMFVFFFPPCRNANLQTAASCHDVNRALYNVNPPYQQQQQPLYSDLDAPPVCLPLQRYAQPLPELPSSDKTHYYQEIESDGAIGTGGKKEAAMDYEKPQSSTVASGLTHKQCDKSEPCKKVKLKEKLMIMTLYFFG